MQPRRIVSPPGLDIDFNDPVQNLDAFTRVFVDTDSSKYSVGWYGGIVYAVIGDSSQLIPLLEVEGIGTTRAERKQDGPGYRVMNRELAYYKDARTGEYLDSWTNPLNQKECEPFPIHNMTVNAEMSPMMKMEMEGTMIEYPFLPPWEFLGPQAHNSFEIHASVPSELQPDEWPVESPGPTTRVSEMFMRYCQISDLANKDLTSVPYVGSLDATVVVVPVDADGADRRPSLFPLLHDEIRRPQRAAAGLPCQGREGSPRVSCGA